MNTHMYIDTHKHTHMHIDEDTELNRGACSKKIVLIALK